MPCDCKIAYDFSKVSATSFFILLTRLFSSSRQSASSLSTVGSCSRHARLIRRHRDLKDSFMISSRFNCLGFSGDRLSSMYSSISTAFVRRFSANRFMTTFGHFILLSFYLHSVMFSGWIRWCLPRFGLPVAPWSVLAIGDSPGVGVR